MQPKQIISVKQTRIKSGRGYLWKCDNGKEYLTRQMAKAIGTTPECLLAKYYRYGLNNEKLFVPSVNYRKPSKTTRAIMVNAKKIKVCDPGDYVMAAGVKMWVSEVVMTGCEDRKDRSGYPIEGEKALVTVCRIMNNGQILKRSPLYIGDNWSH